MASPLSKGLFAAANGESGSIIGALSAVPLADAEAKGVKLASALGIGPSPSLAALRKIHAEELLQTAAKAGGMWFSPTMDGYFLPEDPAQIFVTTKQMHVPLLAGVNSEESGYSAVLGRAQPTVKLPRSAGTPLPRQGRRRVQTLSGGQRNGSQGRGAGVGQRPVKSATAPGLGWIWPRRRAAVRLIIIYTTIRARRCDRKWAT